MYPAWRKASLQFIFLLFLIFGDHLKKIIVNLVLLSRLVFTLNKTLRKLREIKGLSQEKLARLTDVANHPFIEIEAGQNQNPTFETF